MAVIHTNSFVKGFSGRLGSVVFRQVRGKTIMAGKPDKIAKQSTLQRENRIRFKVASAWAKAQMQDPDKKAYYWRKAKKLKLPNAYTAAISDYMRKGEIKEIDTRQYKGKAGDVIRIKIQKKDFAVHKVQVTIYAADGNVIESSMAMKKDRDAFIFKATQSPHDKAPHKIRIVVCDHGRNEVTKEMVL
jgi:hypothetical protein